MASNADLMLRGMGQVGESISNATDRHAVNAEKNRPIDPRVTNKLGLTDDDLEEVKALIADGVSPKHAALYMKQKSQSAQAAPATMQGAAPQSNSGFGANGGLSGNAMSMANQEPTPFKEEGLAGLAASQPSLAQAKPAQKPFTSQMLDDYVKAGGAYSKFASTERYANRETPEQRATRESNNIAQRGGVQRDVAGINTGSREGIAGAGREVQREGISAANQRARDAVAAQLKIANDKLTQVREEQDIRGADKSAEHTLSQAADEVEKLLQAVTKLRTADTEITQDPESAALSAKLEAEYEDAKKRLMELRERRSSGASKSGGSTSHRVKTSTPNGIRSQQDEAALKWANENPNDPRAAAIKQKLGQ